MTKTNTKIHKTNQHMELLKLFSKAEQERKTKINFAKY